MSEKRHFYNFSFAVDGGGFAIAISGYETKGITLARIDENKKYTGGSRNMELLACSYLGYMTREEMTGAAERESGPAIGAPEVLPPAMPMQPVVLADDGVIRFKKNKIVRDLLDFATARCFGLNEIACQEYSAEDRMQLAQLIGYSVSGYGDLGYVSDESLEAAGRAAEALLKVEAGQ